MLDPAHAPAASADRRQEQTLLERMRAGDVDAFATLVDLHFDSITARTTYLLSSADAAEDVVQTVFIQLWELRHTLNPERPLRPYLLRAIHNRVLNERKADAVRSRYREQMSSPDAAASHMVPNPENAILTTALVQEALRQLPVRRQLALRLWFEDGLSHDEIAGTLSISAHAADRLIRRALSDLREILLVSKK